MSARGKAISQTHSIPAPIGGLNASSAIAAMPETDALLMDNWFPQPTLVSLRNGSENWCTGITGWIETLMGYSNKSGTEKLFAIAGTHVYDATSQGAVGAAVVSSLTNARWEYTNVGTPAGAFLYAANATDKPLLYDGSTWVKVDSGTTPAITGVTTTLLRNPTVWKNRVWFVQNNSLLAWYLPVQSVGGAATSFDLSTQFRLGGLLQAIITFSVSSANSFDDYIGFLSTEGELVVYAGTDPSTPGLFNVTGIYRLGKPIGRRCWFKYGSDAVIICSDGFVSVTKIISVGIQQPQTAISYKILLDVNQAVQSYKGNFGWEGTVYPLGNKIIINIPQNENSHQFQFVMNTINESWCTFGQYNSPWNAATFCVLGDSLYFGGNGTVYLADNPQLNTDSSAYIKGSLVPAYSYVGTDRQKRFTMVRPLLETAGTLVPALALNVDYNTKLPTAVPTFSGGAGSPWNTSPWNISPWAISPTIQKRWQTVGGIGFAATIYLIVTASGPTNLLSIDYLYQVGGIL